MDIKRALAIAIKYLRLKEMDKENKGDTHNSNLIKQSADEIDCFLGELIDNSSLFFAHDIIFSDNLTPEESSRFVWILKKAKGEFEIKRNEPVDMLKESINKLLLSDNIEEVAKIYIEADKRLDEIYRYKVESFNGTK